MITDTAKPVRDFDATSENDSVPETPNSPEQPDSSDAFGQVQVQ